ncbi:MAG: YggS family pyridoxal phosphate-dependent enzyme [Anaerolineaceae bacterium]
MITENIQKILKSISADVTILAAAKTRSVEMVREAYQTGLIHFGHNYVQEAAVMIPTMTEEIQWHMIGHLQRNKTKQALALFNMIDSVDSQRLADELEKQAGQLERILPIMIEINIGEEEAKAGIDPDQALQLADYIGNLPHVQLVGVMTMGPLSGDPENSRAYFKQTRRIFEQIKSAHQGVHYLSMGMSNDYRVAIEEGASMVRLGTAIFGERK